MAYRFDMATLKAEQREEVSDAAISLTVRFY